MSNKGVNDYDGIAEAYSAGNEANLVNAYYERPAMLATANRTEDWTMGGQTALTSFWGRPRFLGFLFFGL
jgi:hypothetical protein